MGEGRDMLGARSSPVPQLALLIDSVTDYAIFLLDTDGRVLTWNAGAARTKGYSVAEIVGEHFSVFYTEEDRTSGRPAQALAAAAADGRFEEEAWRVRKDGERFWANALLTAVRDETGNLLGYGKVTRDLTQLRLAQQELEQFASSAAHDLQEPLRTIAGFTDLLERRYADELPDEAREFVDHIATAAERMQRLIRDLLSYARSGSGQAEEVPVVLREALTAALSSLRAALGARGVEVTLEVPEAAAVLADPAGVEMLVQNLLSNAVKFADADRPAVGVTARLEDGEWIVAVTDNGPGIPEAQRERIFEPFRQLRRGDAGGAGLGLSIARRIAERHGGRIEVEPAPGGGSRFWFALPAAE